MCVRSVCDGADVDVAEVCDGVDMDDPNGDG